MSFYGEEKNLVGLYLRLSKEDGDKTESDSIRNQRDLLMDFLRKHPEMKMVDEYVDDGYSGTNFDRPSFQRMIEDAKGRRINCIIVKDLSRFGRNYIETGRYLERVFPIIGIRFISVTDAYDSMNERGGEDQIIIPFKNLINDAYCRDISIKIRSQLDIKRKNGQFIGSFASYGYCKDPENKNRLIIDEYAAEVVQLIFQRRLDGKSPGRIAEELNDMGILPPSEYKRMCGLNFRNGFSPKSTGGKWQIPMVRRILENEIYIGTMVQGKRRKINYKVRQSIFVKPEEWIRKENTHDAIISQATFDMVQQLSKFDTRTAPQQQCVYPLAGLIRCKDCGQNMIRRTVKKGQKTYPYYVCSTNKNGMGCKSHMIRADYVESMALDAVRHQIALILDAEEIAGSIDQLPRQRLGHKIIEKQIDALQREIDRYGKLLLHLYQDKVEGVVDEEEYTNMSETFHMRMNDARGKQAELQRRSHMLLSDENGSNTWINEFRQYRNVETLDRKMLTSLIESVLVADKSHVEIRFRYADRIQELMEAADINKNMVQEVSDAV